MWVQWVSVGALGERGCSVWVNYVGAVGECG